MHTLPETLTLAEANAALASIAQAVGAGDGTVGEVQIDAGALRNFDTSAIAVLPVIAIFVLLQRQFIGGITAGAVKG